MSELKTTSAPLPKVHYLRSGAELSSGLWTVAGGYNNPLVLIDDGVVHAHPGEFKRLLSEVGPMRLVKSDSSEPAKADIMALAKDPRIKHPDVIIAIGGGSAIDRSKALSILLAPGNEYELPESFEAIGQFRRNLPVIACPTTAGPGAEASPALIYSTKTGRKTAVVDVRLVPSTVIVWPDGATTLPIERSLACICDGVAHGLESAMNPDASWIAAEVSMVSAERLVDLARILTQNPFDQMVRSRLAEVSILCAYGLRRSSVGAIHEAAALLTSQYPLRHSTAVSLVLRAFMDCTELRAILAQSHSHSNRLMNKLDSLLRYGNWFRALVPAGIDIVQTPNLTEIVNNATERGRLQPLMNSERLWTSFFAQIRSTFNKGDD